jgi:hypothetical protein
MADASKPIQRALPTGIDLGSDCLKKLREEDLEKVEETVTWLKSPDGHSYVKIHTTVYMRR